MVVETGWRDLPASVAINAARIDEEFAFDILRQSLVDLRHTKLDSVKPEKSHELPIVTDATRVTYIIILAIKTICSQGHGGPA